MKSLFIIVRCLVLYFVLKCFTWIPALLKQVQMHCFFCLNSCFYCRLLKRLKLTCFCEIQGQVRILLLDCQGSQAFHPISMYQMVRTSQLTCPRLQTVHITNYSHLESSCCLATWLVCFTHTKAVGFNNLSFSLVNNTMSVAVYNVVSWDHIMGKIWT